jgi:hypothetical protein
VKRGELYRVAHPSANDPAIISSSHIF